MSSYANKLIARLTHDIQSELGQIGEIRETGHETTLSFMSCLLRLSAIVDLHSMPAYLLKLETQLPLGVVCWRVVRFDDGIEMVNEIDYREWPPARRRFDLEIAAGEIAKAIKAG